MTQVVLAGGGTAGHTSPLIATAQRLQEVQPDIDVTAVGTAKGLESRVIPAAGLPLVLIPPVPLPRSLSPRLLTVPFRLGKAVVEARRVLRRAGADVVVGFGGYVALPVYLAAATLRIPVVVHEQNAVPGLANKVAARFARAVVTSFPHTPLPNARALGLPVRRGISELDRDAARPAARAALGLDGHRPTLLVSGGSQGARRLNVATRDALPRLLAAGVQVLHVLGPRNLTADTVPVSDAETGARYLPVAYVDRMEDAYAAADFMVGRAGAGTVAETAVVGLPALFVPLPHGNGEQARNAEPSVSAGASLLVVDEELTADRLLAEVLPLMSDHETLAAMSAAGRGLVPGDAAGALAHVVLGAAEVQ
ncbi:undecaprenyldiphospho-muramoylpentapeptide beta-N-acetylglucosaminyltransferase [Propionicicella superfundia]|uniref:undecaprenyldiphospho-muramoylpentapeptide beta-N-acetylglucosaminyltransferase n=1 Tax=Propionicicella superfundia TaxID=348582 RepID=UPI00048ADD7E|nr:undecaprenyldiphospho-muramoylpentapeptide beta-N-acetylglucosaminyltransferase [Propionicicella superfundia]